MIGDISGATAREIAASVEAAIRDGAFPAGGPLPTVRALAQSLGRSPATISAAYRILRQRGLIVTGGRRGTRVAPRPAIRVPAPPRPTSPSQLNGRRDLTIGLPDPALLPPLAPALARLDLELEAKLAYGDLEAPDHDLLELARAGFADDGLPGGHIAVTSGAFDAIERIFGAHLRPGDRVLVEDPAYSPIRDLLLALGLVEIPVAVDDRGFLPDRFGAALASGVAAVTLVPRAQNPFGAALDSERAQVLRELLHDHRDVLLLEDDHAGPLAGTPFASLVTPDWPRWAVVRSTSKVLHPDLRLAVVAGDETTVARVEGRQSLGPRWVSHVLQALVVALWGDPGFEPAVTHARAVYAARRNALLGELADRGVTAHGRSGLNVWVPVPEEAPVIRALYDAGWLVMPGERFRIEAPPGVRITVATLRAGEAAEIAGVLAQAAQAARRRAAY